MMPRLRRGDDLWCPTCEQWLHFSRFRRSARRVGQGTVSHFKSKCKACEQTERNDKKNVDRARAILETRASDWAHKIGVNRQFMFETLNWQSLLPYLRAALEPGTLCTSCGHAHMNERDVQLDHRAPPRPEKHPDLARHHARNIQILCAASNNAKGSQPYEQWLDDQEDTRVAVERYRRLRDATAWDSENHPLFASLNSESEPMNMRMW